jgi:hypothetical protein
MTAQLPVTLAAGVPPVDLGQLIANRLSQNVSVRDFGAVGNDKADDTQAFLAALATGHGVFVPNGVYRISSTLPVGRPGLSQALEGESTGVNNSATTIRMMVGGMPAIRLVEQQSRLENFFLTGASTDFSKVLGTVGIVLGTGGNSCDKTWMRGVHVRHFRKANVVFNGAQNSSIHGCSSAFSKYCWLFTNNTRNVYMFGDNCGEWRDPKPAWIPQQIWDLAPDQRLIYIGQPMGVFDPGELTVNKLGTGTSYSENSGASQLQFYGNINERGDRNNAIVEIAEHNGHIEFYSCEFTRTAEGGALVLIHDFDVETGLPPGRVVTGNRSSQITFYNPQLNQTPSGGRKLIVNKSRYPVTVVGYDGCWSVDGPAIYLDNPSGNMLAARPTFEGAWGWRPATAADSVSAIGARLQIQQGVGGAGAIADPMYNIAAGFKDMANRLARLTYVPTAMTGAAAPTGEIWKIQACVDPKLAPRDVAYIKPVHVNKETTEVVPIGPDMTCGLQVIAAVPPAAGSPSSTIAFAKLSFELLG